MLLRYTLRRWNLILAYKLARVGTLCHLLLYGHTPPSVLSLSLSLSITSFVSVYWLTALKEIAAVAVPLQTVFYTIDNVYPQKLGDCRLLSLWPSRSHRNCIFCCCQMMDSIELNPSWILWILWILRTANKDITCVLFLYTNKPYTFTVTLLQVSHNLKVEK